MKVQKITQLKHLEFLEIAKRTNNYFIVLSKIK